MTRRIRFKPGYGDAYVNSGMALVLLNRNEEADRDFDRALALKPRQLQAIAGKGLVSLGLRHFDEARSAVRQRHWRSIRSSQRCSPIAAGSIRRQVTFDKAEADFDAALAIDPELEAGGGARPRSRSSEGKAAAGVRCLQQGACAQPQLRDCAADPGQLLRQAGRRRCRHRAYRPGTGDQARFPGCDHARRSSRWTLPMSVSPPIRPRGDIGGTPSAPRWRAGACRAAISIRTGGSWSAMCLPISGTTRPR